MSERSRRRAADGVRVVAAVVLVASILPVGCASSDQDDEAARWAREVRVLRPEQVGDRGYDVLGQLEERTTIGATGEDGARSEAERRLRYRAARLDADAVVLIGCESAGDARRPSRPTDDLAMTPTLVCQGVAIRWLQP